MSKFDNFIIQGNNRRAVFGWLGYLSVHEFQSERNNYD